MHASVMWDDFYLQKSSNFFKDRHLLRTLLPELMPLDVRENPYLQQVMIPSSSKLVARARTSRTSFGSF